MAKIEMDVTEYDEMRKRSELAEKYAASLEETKKEISELHKQLQEKDKERIEELENSTKSVTYIKKETREEIMLVREDARKTIDRLVELGYAVHNSKMTGHFNGYSHHDLHRNLQSRVTEHIVDAFFTRQVMHSVPVHEVIERKNLDEVISEIREEERKNLDQEVKAKLYRLTEVSNEVSQWKKDYDDIKMENKALMKSIANYEDKELENKRLQAKVFELNQTIHNAYNVFSGLRVWNVASKLTEIQSILKAQINKKDGGNRD